MTTLISLTEELRGLVLPVDEDTRPLPSLTETARLLLDTAAPVGTKHKWADGRTYVKQRGGAWVPAPSAVLAKPAAKPAVPVIPSKVSGGVLTKAAPAKVVPPKAPAERATADHLPDDPFRYFVKTPDAKLIPVSALKTIRARPEGIKNAAKYMAMAFNNEGEKRKPISLKDNGDGSYTVNDGNSTTAMAQAHNWKNIVATVEPADPKPVSKADGPFSSGTNTDEAAASDDAILAMVPELGPTVRRSQGQRGKLADGVTPEQHVRIARDAIAAHARGKDALVSTLARVMPREAKVEPGRTKKLKSALGKIVRKLEESEKKGKPTKYPTVDTLQDLTGCRVVAPDIDTLINSIAALKKEFTVVESDDYVERSQGGPEGWGYRSFHAIIKDKDGLQKEIQLRTPLQHTHAEWCHDIYKPPTDVQRRVVEDNKRVIQDYALGMSEHFYKRDLKKPAGDPLPCPPPVREFFTCL